MVAIHWSHSGIVGDHSSWVAGRSDHADTIEAVGTLGCRDHIDGTVVELGSVVERRRDRLEVAGPRMSAAVVVGKEVPHKAVHTMVPGRSEVVVQRMRGHGPR